MTAQTAAEITAEQIEKPLIDDVSPDVAPTVEEFIAEAAAANKEEAETNAEEPVTAAEESAMRAGRAIERLRGRRWLRISRLSMCTSRLATWSC